MPIDYTKYPQNWKTQIRPRILERSGGRCEWVDQDTGERCEAVNYQPHPTTKSKVILTIAHTQNPDPMDCRDENLMALCQLHHLRLDRHIHMERARETRRRKKESGYTGLLFNL